MYELILGQHAEKDLKKLGKAGKKIAKAFEKRLNLVIAKPKVYGKILEGNLAGLWSSRFLDDYRIVYEIDEHNQKIYLISTGHRNEIYKITSKRIT